MYKSKYHDFRNRFWGGVLPLCIYSTSTGRVKMVRLKCIRGGSVVYKSKYHDTMSTKSILGRCVASCFYSTTTGRVKMARLECIRGGSEQCIRAPLSVLLLISCPSDGYSHTPEGRTVL